MAARISTGICPSWRGFLQEVQFFHRRLEIGLGDAGRLMDRLVPQARQVAEPLFFVVADAAALLHLREAVGGRRQGPSRRRSRERLQTVFEMIAQEEGGYYLLPGTVIVQ